MERGPGNPAAQEGSTAPRSKKVAKEEEELKAKEARKSGLGKVEDFVQHNEKRKQRPLLKDVETTYLHSMRL